MAIKEVFSLYLFRREMMVVKKWNGLYYFLRRIPIIGKKFPLKFYQNFALKEVLNLLGIITSFLLTPLKKLAAIAIPYGLAQILFVSTNSFKTDTFFHMESLELGLIIWLAISFGGKGIMRYFQTLEQEEADFIYSYHLPRKEFLYSQLYVDFGVFTLGYLLVFGFLFFLTGISSLILINALLGYLAFYFLGEALQRLSFKYDPAKKVRKTLGWLTALLYLSISSLSIAGYYFYRVNVLNHWWLTLIFLILLVFSYSVKKQSNEEAYLFYVITKGLGSMEEATEEVTDDFFMEGLALEKDLAYTESQSENLSEKNALDQLLFARYQKPLRQGLYMRGGTLLALGLILLIGGIISHEKIKSAEVLEWLPLAFFALYLSSYGKKIVQICFLNCDRSMLYYPFYRQKEVILNGLFYRLKKTFMYNVLCSIEIFAIFVGIILIGGTDRPLYVGFLSFLTIFSFFNHF